MSLQLSRSDYQVMLVALKSDLREAESWAESLKRSIAAIEHLENSAPSQEGTEP